MNSKLNLIAAALLLTLSWKSHSQESTVRPFQLSFLPNIGTHYQPLQHYTNHVSINLLGGLNEGVKGAELGGIFNIDQKHVQGAQLGSIFNLVGGNSTGVQIGGIFNGTRGYVKGAQIAGVSNNVIHVSGLQLGGIHNLTLGNVTGLQLGGVSNFTGKKSTGMQISGIVNYSKSVSGSQIAGVFNHTDTLKGVQFSGVLNQAATVKGLQIGLVNIADTIMRGATIGLINIVRTGLHQFELSTNDVTDFNLSFRSGSRAFYSILTVGIQAKENAIWGYGAGFGSQILDSKNLLWNLELTTNNLHTTSKMSDKLSLDNRLTLTATHSIKRHFSISGGPVFHVYVAQPIVGSRSDFGLPVTEYHVFNKGTGTNVKMWVGYQLGVRF